MKKLFLLALLAVFALPGRSQTMNYDNQPSVSATGTVEKKIAPDQIYIQIEIKDNDIKGLNVNQIQAKMIQALKQLGIDTEKSLKVDDMDNALRRRNQVQTSKSYQLVVGSAAQAAAVYSSFSDLGISNMSITKVDNSKMEQYRKQARLEAIAQAKLKAQELAQAIGQDIGPAFYIDDRGGYSDMPVATFGLRANKVMAEATMDSANESNLEFRDITLSYNVFARFVLIQQ